MTLTTLLYAAAALLAVLMLVLLAGRTARVAGLAKRSPNSRLRLEESLAIDAKRRLLLVRCDSRQVLLLTGQQDLVLGWLSENTANEAAQ